MMPSQLREKLQQITEQVARINAKSEHLTNLLRANAKRVEEIEEMIDQLAGVDEKSK